jgi:YidC/Oxa1 family membrane protein insertase
MDKKAIIVVALCGVLLVAWFPLTTRLGWSGRPAPAAVPVSTTSPTAPDATGARSEPATPAAAVTAAAAVAPALPVTAPIPLSQPGKLDALLDPASGGLTGVTLLTYNEDDRHTPVRLGNAGQPLGVLQPVTAPGAKPAAAWGPVRVLVAGPERVVLERSLNTTGLSLRQEWRLRPETPYQFECQITVANRNGAPAAYDPMWFSAGTISLPAGQAASGGLGMPSDLSAELRLAASGKLQSFAPKKIGKLSAEETAAMAATPVTWLALHTKYFAFILDGGQAGPAGRALDGARIGESELTVDQQTQLWLNGGVRLAGGILQPGEEQSRLVRVYAGPKEYKNLQALGDGADSLLQMDLFFFFNVGWMGWISQQVLKFMVAIHDYLKTPWAYGLAIIIITFIVKLLFWPLTHYSTMSMKKMQVLQPQITVIREKYKSDPKHQQEKIMELYRENKVNPMGGCLPMLLQIPVFFALFNVFRGAIELRHSTFLWVTDLAQPDTLPWLLFGLPIRPLAILMAATMFLQQKLTPSAMDPTQAKMMMFMTLFFSFLFYSMPAGLTLYWTVNQALGIVQMLLIHRMIKTHPAPLPAKA